MTPDGTVYPYSVFDYTFWCRYLEVFDEVVVFGRVGKIGEVNPETMPPKSSGPGVTFFPLPDFLGAWQYLKAHRKLSAMAKQILTGSDACVLRVPSYLSTMLWRELMKTQRPYAVEVVGDPWQAFSPGTSNSYLRPILRRKWSREMRLQCRQAAVAAYVTQRELQKRYSPSGWSTHYSSIELPEEPIVDQSAVDKRIERIDAKSKSGGPWRLCFVGSLWHLCKSPDVVIDAVADCVKKGVNLELTMVGDGSLRKRLEAQAHHQGIADKIQFLGHLPPGEAIYAQLDQADVFVMPSRSEGLPRSMIEAFARGLPSIGGHEGGFKELLEDKSMVKPIDTPTLSGVIERTISDVEGMKEAVKRNVKKAIEYRTDILQKRRVELYTKLRDITQDWLDKQKGK
jgi:glycosyltransferase involved in cell wall biosynthesis